jgi:hypothetical protein
MLIRKLPLLILPQTSAPSTNSLPRRGDEYGLCYSQAAIPAQAQIS